jgi:hypothetical protein
MPSSSSSVSSSRKRKQQQLSSEQPQLKRQHLVSLFHRRPLHVLAAAAAYDGGKRNHDNNSGSDILSCYADDAKVAHVARNALGACGLQLVGCTRIDKDDDCIYVRLRNAGSLVLRWLSLSFAASQQQQQQTRSTSSCCRELRPGAETVLQLQWVATTTTTTPTATTNRVLLHVTESGTCAALGVRGASGSTHDAEVVRGRTFPLHVNVRQFCIELLLTAAVTTTTTTHKEEAVFHHDGASAAPAALLVAEVKKKKKKKKKPNKQKQMVVRRCLDALLAESDFAIAWLSRSQQLAQQHKSKLSIALALQHYSAFCARLIELQSAADRAGTWL